MVKIFHRYNVAPSKPVVLSQKVDDEFKVQQYGVISVEQQVHRMVMSGRKLEDYRMHNLFNKSSDYPNGIDTDDDMPCERIRDLDYDLTDFSRDMEYLQSKAAPVKKADQIVNSTPVVGEEKVIE